VRLMLDAGHIPGKDPGAVANGLQEADLTGDLVDRIATKLTAYDVEVLQAPRTSLADRSVAANKANVNYFLSIHVNAGGGTGFESFIHPAAGQKTKQYQETVHDAVVGFMAGYDLPDRGMKQKNFQVLRETAMSALLLECGFIDNPKDAELLKDDAFLNGLTNSITAGLVLALKLRRRKESVLEKRITELEMALAREQELNQRYRQIFKQIANMTAPFVANRKEG